MRRRGHWRHALQLRPDRQLRPRAVWGTLYNCTLTAILVAGPIPVRCNRCTLTGNSGDGASGGTLYNCALTGNSGRGRLGHALQLYPDRQFRRRSVWRHALQLHRYFTRPTITPPVHLNYCCTRRCPPWRRQHRPRPATRQRLAPERHFALPRSGQRRLRHRQRH